MFDWTFKVDPVHWREDAYNDHSTTTTKRGRDTASDSNVQLLRLCFCLRQTCKEVINDSGDLLPGSVFWEEAGRQVHQSLAQLLPRSHIGFCFVDLHSAFNVGNVRADACDWKVLGVDKTFSLA